MTLYRYNIHPVELTADLDGLGGLALAHNDDLLSDHGDYLFDELPEDGEGPHNAAEIVIPDFAANDTTHQIYVWEELPTGGLQQWTRRNGAAHSGARGDLPETELLVVAVPPGVSVPSPTSTGGPPAPGTTQSTVKVKITKQGGLPF
ncbi:MAG: hypothetical protein IPK72_08625 [Candidatus Eisenbacteria bacterium]|nr:hypothetical protein [Candidatus Eisenbacteria bacterium]